MQKYKEVIKLRKLRGSQVTVPKIEVNVDTVYIRTNIERIEEEDFAGWEYDEINTLKMNTLSLIANQITRWDLLRFRI